MTEVRILSTGVYLPEKRLTNADLEKMVDTTDKWIVERTGILERRIAAEEDATSDLATRAGKSALERAGLEPGALDLIVLATISPDMLCPATACFVQRNLGAANAAAFDISAACSGFVYALSMGANAIRAGQAKHVLVIGAETMSRFTDWEDRNTCVLFGDGAGAAILAPSDEPSLLFESLGADGTLADLIETPGGGSRNPASPETLEKRLHYIRLKGREVFKSAVKVLESCVRKSAERLGVAIRDIDLIIPHQANVRIIEAAAQRLDVPMEKMYLNVQRYGNTSGATAAIALHEAIEENRVHPGDLIMMITFGSGFTYATSVIRWLGNGV